MAQTEDTELRDLVIEALEKNGSLAKIRALLRANVFLVFEDECDNIKQNDNLENVLNLPEGPLCLSIIHEFLEFCNLKNTLFVYMAESRQKSEYFYEGQKKLVEKLKLTRKDAAKEPVLVQLLRQMSIGSRKYFQQSDVQYTKNDENVMKDDQNCTYIVHEDSSSSATSNTQSDNSSDEKNKLHLRLQLDNSDTDTSSDSTRDKSSSEYIPSEHIIADSMENSSKNLYLSQNEKLIKLKAQEESAQIADKNSTNILNELKMHKTNSSTESTSYIELKPFKGLDHTEFGNNVNTVESLRKDKSDSQHTDKPNTKTEQLLKSPEAKVDLVNSDTMSSASLKNEELESPLQLNTQRNFTEDLEKSLQDTAEYSNDFTSSPVFKTNVENEKPSNFTESFQKDRHKNTNVYDNEHHSSPSSISISDVADLISEKSSTGDQSHRGTVVNYRDKSNSKQQSANDKINLSDDSGDFSESPIPSLSNLSLGAQSE